MSDLEVRIERLDPMRVASVRVISESPEREAWAKLSAWAKPMGLLEDIVEHPIYGFNNPNPSPDSPDYGYELWIRIGSEVDPQGDIAVKDFPGGRYAVTACRVLGDPKGTVPEVWVKLWEWVKASDYEWRETHELERVHDMNAPDEEFTLDLCLPIVG